MDPMKYVDQWFAVHLWRPGDQAKIEIQFWAPRSFPKDKMTAECDVHKMIFSPGLFLVLITTSCLSANLDKETETFIRLVIENVNKDACFFCNGPFFLRYYMEDLSSLQLAFYTHQTPLPFH